MNKYMYIQIHIQLHIHIIHIIHIYIYIYIHMIYTYTDRSYLRIGEEFSELGSNPVQAKIFDPELHGELGGSLEPR